ncbi:urea ABC transporter permease subunit UrtB, partial [Tepidiforma sp.]|uniref:urea ABC transporter permease subunit UrtB n=1 Tax=Tepidiforma sp. TaxID=2682230 RepID=UPI002ADD35D2
MDIWLQQLFNGLSLGSILLLVAIGLAFSFGLMNVINMAHGEMIMVGAYSAYLAEQILGGPMGTSAPDVSFLVALPVAFIVAGVLGMLLEVSLVRRLYGRPLDTLLATWGVSLVLQQAARSIFGAPNVQVTTPSWLQGGIAVTGTFSMPYIRLFIIAMVVVAILLVWLYLVRTAPGRRTRAVMQNREIAAALGVNTARVDMLTFGLASGLAGLAGCALALIGPIGPSLGTYYIVDSFLVVILGGLGQILGTAAAALAIGLTNAFLEFQLSASVA